MTPKKDTPAKGESKDYRRIPDTLNNVVKAVLNTPPRKPGEWKYLKRKREKS